MKYMEHFAGRNAPNAERAIGPLEEGRAVHGFTNGMWSKIDAARYLLKQAGGGRLTISTWTASGAHIDHVWGLTRSEWLQGVRWMLDRSFLTRKPDAAKLLTAKFGTTEVRVLKNHAKFLLIDGKKFDVLYLTSANLNVNKRIENFSVFCGGDLPGEYRELVASVFAEFDDGLDTWGLGSEAKQKKTMMGV